mmetsp:Transcript_27672/g.69007  ORF Transcript_27672/g.69007 Transcript_27672/m.69007 type:complete len:203 (-) Transcript_27672:3140-3748(-)
MGGDALPPQPSVIAIRPGPTVKVVTHAGWVTGHIGCCCRVGFHLVGHGEVLLPYLHVQRRLLRPLSPQLGCALVCQWMTYLREQHGPQQSSRHVAESVGPPRVGEEQLDRFVVHGHLEEERKGGLAPLELCSMPHIRPLQNQHSRVIFRHYTAGSRRLVVPQQRPRRIEAVCGQHVRIGARIRVADQQLSAAVAESCGRLQV